MPYPMAGISSVARESKKTSRQAPEASIPQTRLFFLF
jgi:hypothetical protein